MLVSHLVPALARVATPQRGSTVDDVVRRNLTHAARALKGARAAERKAMAAAELAAREACEAGATEVDVAAVLGVDRMTVRKWRGKM